MARTRILFLCTGNSCRSQMAEGWTRHLLPETHLADSAGIAPGLIDPRAVTVMGEVGIDISGQQPSHVREFEDTPFDLVVTVCDHARESCPVFPGTTPIIHRGFDDPPRLAAKLLDDQMALDCYRRVRDEIRDFISTLPEISP